MMDYELLLDDEVKAFVAETLSWYPRDAYAQTVEENRATYDAMCRAFFLGYPDGVSAHDANLGGVPTRQYQSDLAGADALVLYFHGGGFVLGGLDSHDDVSAEIAGETGVPVWAVDYRLCPENSRLDALEDAGSVLSVAREQGHDRIILAGDSAGGWLAAALAHQWRNADDIIGQVLIYPGLGGAMAKPSMTRHAHAPLLSAEEVQSYALDPREDAHSPLAQTEFSGLPPTLVLAAECDPLADDGTFYTDAIKAAGGQALMFVEPGLVHGHLRARHMSARAARSFERVTQAVGQLAQSGKLDREILLK